MQNVFVSSSTVISGSLVKGGTGFGVVEQNYGPTTISYVTSSLSLYLDAGLTNSYPGSGSTWTDIVGSKTFTLVNSPTYSSNNGGYISFAPASSQYATSSTSLPNLSTWSVEVWHYYTGTNSGGLPCIVTELYPGATSNINFSLGSDTTSGLQNGFFNGAWRVTPSYSLTANNWYHIVGTYDGSTIKLYVNNSLVQSANYSGTPISSQGGIRLMRRWDNAEYWGGYLGLVRIYSTALSTTSITQNYNNGSSRFLGIGGGTGFYNTITPPAGGYTFYKTKPANGPIIKVASNDTELINYIQQETGTTYSISGALQWAATQNNVAVANFDYPNIITSGSVLYLDAGYTVSSPRTGSSWYDLSGNGNNGLYVGTGPTFNSANSGSLVFTPANNQFISSSTGVANLTTTGITVSSWFKFDAQPNTIMRFATVDSEIACVRKNGTNAEFFVKVGGTITTMARVQTFTNGVWYNMVGTYDNSGTAIIYINGSQLGTTASITGNLTTTSAGYKISSEAASESMSGSIAIVQVYNRALSATEVATNYNALKGRFGLS